MALVKCKNFAGPQHSGRNFQIQGKLLKILILSLYSKRYRWLRGKLEGIGIT